MKRMAIAVGLLCGAAAAPADEPALRDPWVPPAVREKARPQEETRGPALRAQVEAKLRSRFDAADVEHRGSITREQAAAAQLGFVVRHFDAMDTAATGRVSFEDYKRFLRSRGARTL